MNAYPTLATIHEAYDSIASRLDERLETVDHFATLGLVQLSAEDIAGEYWFAEEITPGAYCVGEGTDGLTMPYQTRPECEEALWAHYWKAVRKGYI